jgi:citronellol/citronellal dehydrogenase
MHPDLDRPDLSDRVALVTGTTRGIGKELALTLAESGASVVSTGKTTEDDDTELPGSVEQTAREARERGAEAIGVELDVRDPESCQHAVDRAVEEFGRLDYLVNNAGAIQLASVADLPVDRFDLLMDVNVRGAYACTRAALGQMLEQGHGHVLMMSPPFAVDRAPGKAAYALSKLGMTFVAKSLAGEVAGEGVAANALWPVTAIDTRATRYFGLGTEADWRRPEVVADAALEVLRREPDECTGNAFYDEELLAAAGVEDLSYYDLVEDADPGPTSAQLFDPGFRREDRGAGEGGDADE